MARYAAAVGCLLAAGCGGAPQSSAPNTQSTSQSSRAQVAPGTFIPGTGQGSGSIDGLVDGLVDIGGGRQIYLQCAGAGPRTVVLLSGSVVAADNWEYTGNPADEANPVQKSDSAVYPEVAKFTRVCAYDRPGTGRMHSAPGRSTVVAQPTTAQAGVADLHALLAAAKIAPPYVLVGHSWGGLIAQAYARTFPAEITGLVLVDPSTQYLPTVLPPPVWEQWVQKDPSSETPDHPASIEALNASPPLPPMPVSVLTSDKPWDYLGIGDAATYWPQ
jgi:pimeloyl-ACP methyl ester carboxylesterase